MITIYDDVTLFDYVKRYFRNVASYTPRKYLKNKKTNIIIMKLKTQFKKMFIRNINVLIQCPSNLIDTNIIVYRKRLA